MPLNQPLTTIQRELRELIAEDFAAALLRLKELLPDAAEKQADVTSLLGRLNDSNKKYARNIISNEEYQREKDRIRADFYELVRGLEDYDFEEVAAQKPHPDGKNVPKTGSVLYRIPHRMLLQKSTRCVVRVAVDEDAIVENITLDDDVRQRHRLLVSDAMEAQLLDPSGGENFFITSPNVVRQLVRDTGYTEWLFYVTPLHEGTHELIVKVSVLENVPNIGLVPREVTLEETVQIVTEPPVPYTEEPPLKSAGISFALLAAGIDTDTPPPPPSPVAKELSKVTGRLAAILVIGIAAIIAALLWNKDWFSSEPVATRSVGIVVHAPDDNVAEAFWVSGKKIQMKSISPGVWMALTQVPDDYVWRDIIFQGDISEGTLWRSRLIGTTTHLYVPMYGDTSCGVFVKVDTIIRPAEQWRLVWQKSPTENVIFWARPLSDTTFFAPFGEWCATLYGSNAKRDLYFENGDFRLAMYDVLLGKRPATLVFRFSPAVGPGMYDSNVSLTFSQLVSLKGVRVNGHRVRQFAPYDIVENTHQKAGVSFIINALNVDGLGSKAKNYTIEILSSDCTCAKKVFAAKPDIRGSIACRDKPTQPIKPIMSDATPPPTGKISLYLPQKLEEHVKDLEITLDGAHYSSSIVIKNGKVDLPLKPREEWCNLCLQFLAGYTSGKALELGCYYGPIERGMQLKLVNGKIIRI